MDGAGEISAVSERGCITADSATSVCTKCDTFSAGGLGGTGAEETGLRWWSTGAGDCEHDLERSVSTNHPVLSFTLFTAVFIVETTCRSKWLNARETTTKGECKLAQVFVAARSPLRCLPRHNDKQSMQVVRGHAQSCLIFRTLTSESI